MPLVTLHHLLNVSVQLANKRRLKKNSVYAGLEPWHTNITIIITNYRSYTTLAILGYKSNMFVYLQLICSTLAVISEHFSSVLKIVSTKNSTRFYFHWQSYNPVTIVKEDERNKYAINV
jgi:hypothetical protein